MKVLIIDNYDSFTFNLYQYIGELLNDRQESSKEEHRVVVKRNNEISLQWVLDFNPDRIIISPGPGHPADPEYFGVCSDVILDLGKRVPLLGVCLGMQGITHLFGGRVIRAELPMHGKLSPIIHDAAGAFGGLPQNLEVMRYHSLIADPATIPDCLEITAVTSCFGETTIAQSLAAGEEIMGIRHKEYPIEGIQFHPESFGTEGGMRMVNNFLIAEI